MKALRFLLGILRPRRQSAHSAAAAAATHRLLPQGYQALAQSNACISHCIIGCGRRALCTVPDMATAFRLQPFSSSTAAQPVAVSHDPRRTPAAGVLDHQRQRRSRHTLGAASDSARRASTCIHAQQQQQPPQQQLEQQQEQQEPEAPPLADAKFQPFAPRNAAHRLISEFRQHRRPLGAPGGDDGSVLVVQPLTSGWVPAAAELLTDSFAEAISGVGFSRYLRRQVEAYLKQHMLLPPKAVVLVAVLLPPPEQQRERQRQWEEARRSEQEPTSSADSSPSSSSSSSSSGSDDAWNAASAGEVYLSPADACPRMRRCSQGDRRPPGRGGAPAPREAASYDQHAKGRPGTHAGLLVCGRCATPTGFG